MLARAVRITLRGVTALGTPTATGPNPWPRRSQSTRPGPGPPALLPVGHSPGRCRCRQRRWSLTPPLSSLTLAGGVCLLLQLSSRCRPEGRSAPVLAVSHGNHVCGSREVPLVKQVHERRNPDCFSVPIVTARAIFGKFQGQSPRANPAFLRRKSTREGARPSRGGCSRTRVRLLEHLQYRPKDTVEAIETWSRAHGLQHPVDLRI